MSETEHLKGELIPIFSSSKLEQSCKHLMNLLRENKETFQTHQEWLEDWGYDKFYIHGNTIYLIDSVAIDVSNADIANAEKKENGCIDFEVRYYNGGSSFEEMLEQALEKLKNKDN